MKKLSQWASRHNRIAICLIILFELTNGFNGVLLGANLLGDLPVTCLYVAMLALIGVALSLQRHAPDARLANSYWLTRRWIFTAFLSNFLLFGLLGGIWSQRVQNLHSTAGVFGSRQVDVARDTLPLADSVHLAHQSVVKTRATSVRSSSGQRASYIALGILGIGLTLLITGLACTIACSGYGFLALLVFYLGLGSMAGSVYFFGRSSQNTLKRRDMTPDERRRDSRRFWLPWVILVGVFSVIFLASASR